MLPYNPPGHISSENSTSKRFIHHSVHSSIVYNSQYMEATKLSIDKWMGKEDMVYIYI